MKRELTYADQAKRIQKKYKGRTDKLSMDSMHRELAALEQQQEAIRAQMNLIEPQQMAAWGGPGGYVNQPDNNLLAMGGMIKRADGSYSKRGLWDNIRANKGSGKKPTAEMLKQEKKIKAEYAMGGGIDNPGFRALPIEVQNNIKNNMAMGGKYVTAGNEYHKVYRNANGDIMVNHPKENKGKWDTINLTEKSNANTIAEGVKSVKDWHKNNPYAYGGMIYAMGGEIENAIAPAFFSHGGGIHIDPSKKGTFTAAATKHGKSVQGFASQVLANKENYSPAMVKKANFAVNSTKFKHSYGGYLNKFVLDSEHDITEEEAAYLKKLGYDFEII